MFFDSVTVPGSNVVFPPGKGLSGSLMAIDIARTSISAGCCGLISSSLDLALAFAGDRQMFGKSELEFQGIQWMLADVATDLEASRLLYKHASELMGTPEGAVAAAHAKRFAPDAAQKAAARQRCFVFSEKRCTDRHSMSRRVRATFVISNQCSLIAGLWPWIILTQKLNFPFSTCWPR